VVDGYILPDAVAFTEKAKVVRKATGYERQRAEAALSLIGSLTGRAGIPAAAERISDAAEGRYMDVQPEPDGRIRSIAGEDQRDQLT
jgi:hypothetical protein